MTVWNFRKAASGSETRMSDAVLVGRDGFSCIGISKSVDFNTSYSDERLSRIKTCNKLDESALSLVSITGSKLAKNDRLAFIREIERLRGSYVISYITGTSALSRL